MKSSATLDMIVRPAAGIDLFPGESSGYNSSASSVTGDQSPCWGDQSAKRLSIVREEDGGVGGAAAAAAGQSRPKFWQRKELDVRKDRLLMVEPPCISAESFRNPASAQQKQRKHSLRTEANTTIIKLSDSGTVINNTIIPTTSQQDQINPKFETNRHQNDQPPPPPPQHKCKPIITKSDSNFVRNNNTADICLVSRKIETKTVTVEVHHGGGGGGEREVLPQTAAGKKVNEQVVIPPPPPMCFANNENRSSSSLSDKSDLSSAISQELKKRAEVSVVCFEMKYIFQFAGVFQRGKYAVNEANFGHPSLQQPNKILLGKARSAIGAGGCSSDDTPNAKHNALIDEFKLAHKKMFKNGFARSLTCNEDKVNGKIFTNIFNQNKFF